MDDILSKAMAMMHGVTSGSPNSILKLGPMVTAEILLEGECVSALVDTGYYCIAGMYCEDSS